MGAPTNLAAIGFKEKDIEKAVDTVLAKPYANPKELTKKGLIDMLVRVMPDNFRYKIFILHKKNLSGLSISSVNFFGKKAQHTLSTSSRKFIQ